MSSHAQTLVFQNYSPARFAALQQLLLAKGLNLAGAIGDVKEFGADVSYTWANNGLTLLVRSAPHFHSMEGFCQELSQAVNGVPVQ